MTIWQKINDFSKNEKKEQIIESIFWSIALPGFSQILNGRLFKGILFLVLEMVINVKANFNEIIQLSFMGQIDAAIAQTNFQWLMFYPCLYFFSMWDAFKSSGGGKSHFSYLPFVFSGFFVTLGIMYSTKLEVFGFLLGPVWLPMLGVIPGLIIGFSLKRILTSH